VNLTRVETTMLVMLAVLIVWTVVLVVKEFKTADRKIEAIIDRTEAEIREDRLKDLLTTLNLYIGHYAWTQLTTEQKELLADVVDSEHEKQDMNDGHWGTDLAYRPTERWWRA